MRGWPSDPLICRQPRKLGPVSVNKGLKRRILPPDEVCYSGVKKEQQMGSPEIIPFDGPLGAEIRGIDRAYPSSGNARG